MHASTQSPRIPLDDLRAFVEGYPEGGRIPRHSHEQDQLALISQAAAIIETDTMYVVHPLLKALWLPAGIEHSVYSPRPTSARARKLADHFMSTPADGRALEIVALEIGGASLRTFERLFLDETGLSLAAWRRQSRMLASLSLLAEGRSINEVARAVGYESAAAFSAAFKQCVGVPPSSHEHTGRP